MKYSAALCASLILAAASSLSAATISFGNQNQIEGDTFTGLQQDGFDVSPTGPVVWDDTQNTGFQGSSASALLVGEQSVQSIVITSIDGSPFALTTIELAVDGNGDALAPLTIQGTDSAGTFLETINMPSMAAAGTVLNDLRFRRITQAEIFSGGTANSAIASFITDTAAVPEPSSFALIALGGLAGLARRRRS